MKPLAALFSQNAKLCGSIAKILPREGMKTRPIEKLDNVVNLQLDMILFVHNPTRK